MQKFLTLTFFQSNIVTPTSTSAAKRKAAPIAPPKHHGALSSVPNPSVQVQYPLPPQQQQPFANPTFMVPNVGIVQQCAPPGIYYAPVYHHHQYPMPYGMAPYQYDHVQIPMTPMFCCPRNAIHHYEIKANLKPAVGRKPHDWFCPQKPPPKTDR